jgi:hypothetical protein
VVTSGFLFPLAGVALYDELINAGDKFNFNVPMLATFIVENLTFGIADSLAPRAPQARISRYLPFAKRREARE